MVADNFLSAHGINRRDFMKLCAGMAATLGLSNQAVAKMATALTSPERPPVIWIGAQECTGCTESLLRATHPTIENLILNTISLEYHEVLSAAFGHQAEENKHNAIERYKGKYVLVVDGSIPRKDGGVGGITVNQQAYDRNTMRAMLKAFLKQPLARRVFLNDDVLINEGLCRHAGGHDNHAHFEIKPPPRVGQN